MFGPLALRFFRSLPSGEHSCIIEPKVEPNDTLKPASPDSHGFTGTGIASAGDPLQNHSPSEITPLRWPGFRLVTAGRAKRLILFLLIFLGIRYFWIGEWESSLMLTLGSLGVVWLARWMFSIIPHVRKADVDIKLKFLQSTGLLLTAFGLLLSYQNSVVNRFDATKPLFSLERSSSSPGSFNERNDGGWVMFLGSANKKYADIRRSAAPKFHDWNTGTLWDDKTSRCEFDLAPHRYQVVHGDHVGVFRVSSVAPCRALLGWTDADGNFYEQRFELRGPDQGPQVDAPRVRLRMRSWISGAFQWLQLSERNLPWLPERENEKDEDYFDATS